MKNIICKFKYHFPMSWEILIDLIKVFLSIIGLFISFFKVLDSILNKDMISVFNKNFGLFFSIAIFITIVKNIRFTTRKTFKIPKSNVKLTIKYGDIIKEKKDVVIPTNTCFATNMEKEFISKKSVQGNFQTKYFNKNIDNLNHLLKEELDKCPSTGYLKINSKRNAIYDIGTTCKICHNDRFVYFLATNDINRHGHPINQTIDNLYLSLDGLWDSLIEKGHMRPIAIPLICSGKAGITEVTKQKSLNEIIASFIKKISHGVKFTDELIIYIYPTDLEYIDIYETIKFIDHQFYILK